MSKNRSVEDIVVLDINAIINIAKSSDWKNNLNKLTQLYKVVVPTPALYEFQLYRHKSSDSEIEFGKTISAADRHDCSSFEMACRFGKLKNGLYVVNPSHNEWYAATIRMSKHIESKDLRSSGIKKRHMAHIIYSIARNIFGTICTDNAKDFVDITGIAKESGWHDGEMTIKSLSDYISIT
ncbi:hypothetical protein [Photobacterium carnosum]|uniref:PIN domain-containing protein n=1 Tax=Photobacterium carnosum TaxID=2023717 RepID=A0A2N4USF0_9GAMM|nr:hypothetical protein [Photobacterium carnosum]PLC57946.1 hypothetical protein CIK00_10840 [Photobacterium carnosum]